MSTAPWETTQAAETARLGRAGASLSLPAMPEDGCTHHRRVRHELRDALAVMGFSAVTSCLLALLLMLLMRTGG